jgi:hypothetical protein
VEVILYLLAAAGVTFALQHKLPFLYNKLSILDSMLKCTYCTGFHSGWLVCLIVAWDTLSAANLFVFSFASAIFSYALDEVIKSIEEASYGDDE